jgi:hypothetical protein
VLRHHERGRATRYPRSTTASITQGRPSEVDPTVPSLGSPRADAVWRGPAPSPPHTSDFASMTSPARWLWSRLRAPRALAACAPTTRSRASVRSCGSHASTVVTDPPDYGSPLDLPGVAFPTPGSCPDMRTLRLCAPAPNRRSWRSKRVSCHSQASRSVTATTDSTPQDSPQATWRFLSKRWPPSDDAVSL